MLTKLYVQLSINRAWDNYFSEERMSTPLVSYILLGVILFVMFIKVLFWLQFLYLRHQLKKHSMMNRNKVKELTDLPALYVLKSKQNYNADEKKRLTFWVYDIESNMFTSLYNNALPADNMSYESCLIFIHPDDRETYKNDIHLLSSGLIESMTEFLRFYHHGVYETHRFNAIALKSVLTGKVHKIIGTEENVSR